MNEKKLKYQNHKTARKDLKDEKYDNKEQTKEIQIFV